MARKPKQAAPPPTPQPRHWAAGVGHLLPTTRDYAEARRAIQVFGKGQKVTVYNSYEQVLQVNFLIDAAATETDAERQELCEQAHGLATILALQNASTVPGIYLVW